MFYNKITEFKIIPKKLAGMAFSSLFFLASISTSYAATINIHLTEGGPLWAQFGLEARKPLYRDGLPVPIKEGTIDVMDCQAIAQDDCSGACDAGDLLTSTEAGAICNAVAQLQKHIKNDVTLETEFYFVNLSPISPSAIGGSIPNIRTIVANNKSKDIFKGYKIGRKLLQAQNAKEQDSDMIVNHIPRITQLSTILPDDPYYNNNPNFKGNKWKPTAMGITTAQLKALGIRPSVGQVNLTDGDLSLYSALANDGRHVDFLMLLADTSAAGAALTFDFDVTKGSNPANAPCSIPASATDMQGPYDIATYNAIDFTDPCTWPQGFNLNDPKRVVDLQGVVIHELAHGLGFISNIGEETATGGITLPAPDGVLPLNQQSVFLMDLFRIQNAEAKSIRRYQDFTKASRFWSVDSLISDESGSSHFCRLDEGTAVFVAGIRDGQPEIINMTSGSYFDGGVYTGGVGNVVAGDTFQSSHARNPFKAVPVNGFELEGCTVSGGGAVGNGWVKQFIFIDEPEGQSPPGMVMRPFSGYHNPTVITSRDLKILDLIGWDIDPSGSQSTVLSPDSSVPTNDFLVNEEDFAKSNGVTFIKSSKIIIE